MHRFRNFNFKVEWRAGIITQVRPNLKLMISESHQMNFVENQMEEVKITLELEKEVGLGWAKKRQECSHVGSRLGSQWFLNDLNNFHSTFTIFFLNMDISSKKLVF